VNEEAANSAALPDFGFVAFQATACAFRFLRQPSTDLHGDRLATLCAIPFDAPNWPLRAHN
jgi:hypothetical protein